MSQEPDPSIGKSELTAMVAMMFATIALSIDAMLPAFPAITAELSPEDPNRTQLVLTSFLFGMGVGVFFTGALADAFGRRAVILGGALLYGVAALLATLSPSLEMLVVSRFLMGLGAAGPRIAGLALVRDRFKGRDMAQIMAYVMMIFTLIPAIAPTLGAGILLVSSWRGIFVTFILFALMILLWSGNRLPETLHPSNRRPLRISSILSAGKEVMQHPATRISILVQTLCMGILFSFLTMVQPVYDTVYLRADSFPYWFGLVALLAGVGNIINARLVARIGMRRIVSAALLFQVTISAIMVVASLSLLPANVPFALFVFWQFTVFLIVVAVMGNLNAIAMEPLGHIAGLAASVIGACSTVGGILIAGPLGQLFDGSLRPLSVGVLLMALTGSYLMWKLAQIEGQ